MGNIIIVKGKLGLPIGSYEYEKGYGVHARHYASGAKRTYLTNGYRAAVGGDVVGEDGSRRDVNSAKRLARKWVEQEG